MAWSFPFVRLPSPIAQICVSALLYMNICKPRVDHLYGTNLVSAVICLPLRPVQNLQLPKPGDFLLRYARMCVIHSKLIFLEQKHPKDGIEVDSTDMP